MVHHGSAFSSESGDPSLAEAVASGRFNELAPRMEALCSYALKLTVTPWDMTKDDLEPLRELGMTDRDIVDANQVVSYFNYVNRVADGLGVELEPGWPEEVAKHRSYQLRNVVR